MVDWLVGGLAGWLIGWLVGWLVGLAGGGCKGRGQIQRDREMSGIGVHDVKLTKKSIKITKKKNSQVMWDAFNPST